MKSKPHSWIHCYYPQPAAKLRLFCLPYAGGGAPVFRPWAKALQEVEVCPIHLPGRWGRTTEAPFKKWKPLVEALAGEVAPFLDKEFAFYGHSMGALIAFELTRELRRRKAKQPQCLVVSAFRAPQLPRRRGKTVHDLPEREFLIEVQRLKGTPEEFIQHQELMKVFAPLIRADLELVETYEYQKDKPLICPILAIGGREDTEVSEAELCAWREQTTGGFQLQMLPGGHFFIQTHGEDLLQVIQSALALHNIAGS